MKLPAFCFGVAGLLLVSVSALEVRHHSTFGHWFGWGWHVDVLTDEVHELFVGSARHVQYMAVTNFGLLPELVDLCEPDAGGVPITRTRVERRSSTGWSPDSPAWPRFCAIGHATSRTIWPLKTFYSEPVIVSWSGNQGDWIRLVTTTRTDRAAGRQFVSEPIRQIERAPAHCPQECIAIRSIRFCDSTRASGCPLVEQWKNDPGSLHPAGVDLLVQLENLDAKRSAENLIVLTTFDSIVAPTNQFGLAQLESLKTLVGWSMEGPPQITQVPSLSAGATASIRVRGMDIGKRVADFENDLLWPWWIRANLRIEDRAGHHVADGHVELALIPAAHRLVPNPTPVVDRHPGVHPITYPVRPRRFW